TGESPGAEQGIHVAFAESRVIEGPDDALGQDQRFALISSRRFAGIAFEPAKFS
ncbi:MAG: hypothetical protein IID60_09340, partial [Proteobacteria bacterium]|nr:hypothetical protein [Pseudomonadota bacterium]